MSSPLLDLPLDILTDNLLPDLSPTSLAALSATNHSLHTLVTGQAGEAVWRTKARQDYNFPTGSTGRRTGWMELYKRLEKRSCYVWGENANGRLGLGLSRSSPKLIGTGLPIPTRLPLPHPVISLAAGGFSFHALTTTGSLLVWGTMDGENMVTRGVPLTHAGMALERPIVLPASASGAMGHIVQVEAGRKHVVLRNSEGKVWEYRSWGRAYKVEDSEGSWGSHDEIIQVEAGWEHSLVLTSKGNAYVWWQLGSAQLSRLAKEAGEEELKDPNKEGTTFVATVSTLRLPSLPTTKDEQDKITAIASGDHFVLALTSHAKVYFLDISPVPDPNNPGAQVGSRDPEDSPIRSKASRELLDNAFVSGQRKWQLMSRFCDIEDVGQLPEYVDENATLTPPPSDFRITHISAHFHSFCVYAVPSTSDSKGSVVLLGQDDWSSTSFPTVIPELQNKSVIKVVQGDYHTVALTSSGRLLSWGSYSNGALGLGHPTLPDTPLYATTSSAAEAPHTTPAGRPTQPPTTFPMMPSGQPWIRPNIPLQRHPSPPEKIEHPTLIRFPGESDFSGVLNQETEKRNEGKFVFDVSAAGWHSGCLAVELGETDVGDEKEEEEDDRERRDFENQMRAGEGAGRGITPIFRGGIRPFRIGYPGRGAMRAGFGRGVENSE